MNELEIIVTVNGVVIHQETVSKADYFERITELEERFHYALFTVGEFDENDELVDKVVFLP